MAVPGAYFFWALDVNVCPCNAGNKRSVATRMFFRSNRFTSLHHLDHDVERRPGLRLPCKRLQINIMSTFFFIF